MSRSLTSDQFFLAIMAVLTKRGFKDALLTPELDEKFEAAYTLLLTISKKAGVAPNFSYKLHGVSGVLRDTIDSASRNRVVSLENPSFTRIRTRLTEQSANFHLARLPIREEYINSIVDSCFSDLTHKNEQTAA